MKEKQLDYIRDFIQKMLAAKPAFYGSIKFNFQNGVLANSNILETVLYVEDKQKIS